MALSPDRVRAFYDRFGSRQDAQGFYEDAALERLLSAAGLGSAGSLFEFGCGTGKLAARILAAHPKLHYVGVDVSTTMVKLARGRLTPWAGRAVVRQVPPGVPTLPPSDRVLSTYVLDLLDGDEIRQFLAAAAESVGASGRVCLASLAEGPWVLPRLVSSAWGLAWRVAPQWVGGCRPIRLGDYLDGEWVREMSAGVTNWGVTSEVVVLRRDAAPTSGRPDEEALG